MTFAPLFGLAPGGVYLAGTVTRPAGELLPHPFTLTSPARSKPAGGVAVWSLWHFPYPPGAERWALPTTAPCGVRTFLPGMSPGRNPGAGAIIHPPRPLPTIRF